METVSPNQKLTLIIGGNVKVSPNGKPIINLEGLVVDSNGNTKLLVSNKFCKLGDTLPSGTYRHSSTAPFTRIHNFKILPAISITQKSGSIMTYTGVDSYQNDKGVTFTVPYNFKTLTLQSGIELWATQGLTQLEKRYINARLLSGEVLFDADGVWIVARKGSTFNPVSINAVIQNGVAKSAFNSSTVYNEILPDNAGTLIITNNGTQVSNPKVGVYQLNIGRLIISESPVIKICVSNTSTYAILNPLMEFESLSGVKREYIDRKLKTGAVRISTLTGCHDYKSILLVGNAVQTNTNYIAINGPCVVYIETARINYRYEL